MWTTGLVYPFKNVTYKSESNWIDLRISLLKFPILAIILGDDSFAFIILGVAFILDW